MQVYRTLVIERDSNIGGSRDTSETAGNRDREDRGFNKHVARRRNVPDASPRCPIGQATKQKRNWTEVEGGDNGH